MVNSNTNFGVTIDEIFAIMGGANDAYFEDPVTKLEHSLQAAFLAHHFVDSSGKLVHSNGSEVVESLDIGVVSRASYELMQALREGANIEEIGNSIVVSALLHDIGHLNTDPNRKNMGEYGVRGHEKHGADYLHGLGFSSDVAELVRGHAIAKIILAEDPEYMNRLSDASKHTLTYQRKDTTTQDLERFKQSPLRDAMLLVRVFDDEAKKPDRLVYPLSHYKPSLLQDLQRAA